MDQLISRSRFHSFARLSDWWSCKITKIFKFLDQCFAKSVSNSWNLLDGSTTVLLETLFQDRSRAKQLLKNLNILHFSRENKCFLMDQLILSEIRTPWNSFLIAHLSWCHDSIFYSKNRAFGMKGNRESYAIPTGFDVGSFFVWR